MVSCRVKKLVFVRLQFSMEHHEWVSINALPYSEWVSINAPPYSEACFYFEVGDCIAAS